MDWDELPALHTVTAGFYGLDSQCSYSSMLKGTCEGFDWKWAGECVLQFSSTEGLDRL